MVQRLRHADAVSTLAVGLPAVPVVTPVSGPVRNDGAVRRAIVEQPTVYIIEDDPGMRESLRHLLASVAIPTEMFASAEEFLESQNGWRAGCVVTDVCLPGMSGFDLQRALARRNIPLPIIMLTGYGDVPTAVRAMKAGAIDFLAKPFSGQLLLDSIAYAFKVNDQVSSAGAQRERLRQRFALLTRREREVMGRVVLGRTNKSIASEFGITEKTIEIYRAQVMTKMEAGSLPELVRFAAVLEGTGA